MSNNSVVSEHPRCAALLHGGKRCRSVAVTETGFCERHGAVAEDRGAEAVRRGEHLPVRRRRVVGVPVVAETITETIDGSGTIDPAWVRPRLAEAAAASVEEIRRVLLETATGANKQLWATIVCRGGGEFEIYGLNDDPVTLGEMNADMTSLALDETRLAIELTDRERRTMRGVADP
jgi:hypothetical protein